MTMRFRQIRDAIIQILGDNAAGQFRVIGFQEQHMAATENLDNERSVQVFYKKGDIPGGENGSSDGFMHEMIFGLELTAAKAAEGDLAALNNPGDPSGVATALANFMDASHVADRSWDELLDLVVQIIMSPIYLDFGLEPTPENPDGFTIGSRRLEEIEKKQPLPYGEYVTITGSVLLKCKINELVVGVTPTPLEGLNTQIDIKDDDVEQTAVEVNEFGGP